MVTGKKRKALNHNLWSDFLNWSYARLTKDGVLLYITPTSWMSPTSKNKDIQDYLSLEIIPSSFKNRYLEQISLRNFDKEKKRISLRTFDTKVLILRSKK